MEKKKGYGKSKNATQIIKSNGEIGNDIKITIMVVGVPKGSGADDLC